MGSVEYLGVVTFPEEWLPIVRGALLQLTHGRYWDEKTGSILDVQSRASAIYEEYDAVPLQQLIDAINNIQCDQTGLEEQLAQLTLNVGGINSELNAMRSELGAELDFPGLIAAIGSINLGTPTDLTGVEGALGGIITALGDIFTKIAEVRDAITDGLLNQVDAGNNIAYGSEGIDGQLQRLTDIATALQNMLAYMGVQTDFYGQTMTTQNEQLREIVRSIASKQSEFYVICQQSLIEANQPSTPAPVETGDDVCLNTVAMYLMYSKFFNTLAENYPPDIIIWPVTAQQYIEQNFALFVAAYLSPVLANFLGLAKQVSDDMTSTGLPWTWADLAAEWDSLAVQGDFICTFNTVPTSDELTSSDVTLWAAGSPVLSNAMKSAIPYIGAWDTISYITREYLGGNNGSFDQFNLLRDQLRDGFNCFDWASCQ